MSRSSRVVFAAAVATAMVTAVRIRSNILPIAVSLNPDEAELMAAGRRAALSLTPFDTFTTNTYGPVWPWLLGLAHRVGLPLTVPAAHLLSALTVGVVCSIAAWAVWRRWNVVVAVAVFSPIVIHWAKGFFAWDFVTLSTELLPLVILVTGCAIAFVPRPLSTRRALAAAIVLGAAAWTKYQIALIVAVALLALIVKMVASGHRAARVALVGGAAPASVMAVMMTWAVLAGVPGWKILEGPWFAFFYASSGGLAKLRPSVADRFTAAWNTVEQFRSFIPLAVLLAVSVVIGLRSVARGDHGKFMSLSALHATVTLALAVVAVAASFVSLMVLVPIYAHYAYLFVAGMVLAAFLVASVPAPAPAVVALPDAPGVARLRVPPRARLSIGTVGIIALVFWSASPIVQRTDLPASVLNAGAQSWKPTHFVLSQKAAMVERIVLDGGDSLSARCPARSKVMAWGWAPELYSQYDWVPATRYVVNPMQYPDFTTNTHAYRARLLSELRAERPVCVIEASVMALFQPLTIDTLWPGLSTELDYSYTRLAAVADGKTPVTVWVRNSP